MVGFKSFGDRTLVEFHKGMTAIVGPNGCGKSNVLDAIRWVLGEQSAKALRGGSMQDVIFNGADGRKASGMAEVSLTFSECEAELGTEYHEVRVTRRVFRDGQGEYEMNKTPCRLKDIQQLFMDTGIGRTAYSIMEQGKIDSILSSKPEDRRAIFEEAAGITKFKSQKKEALRKLELTDGNLLRITDIIKEVNRQIGSLQRQASKARRYKEISDKLKDLDTQLAAHQYRELKKAVEDGEARVAELQGKLDELQKGIDERDGALRQKRVDWENAEDRVRSGEQQKAQLENVRTQAQQQIAFHTQRTEEFQGFMERDRIEIAGTEEKIRFQNEQLTALRAELEKASGELERLTEELQTSQAAWQTKRDEAAGLVRERDHLEAKLFANQRQQESHRARLAALENEQRNFTAKLERFQESEQQWQQRKQELEAERGELQERLRNREETLAQAERSVQDNAGMREQMQQALRTNADALEQVERELQHLTVRKQALEQFIASRAGYSEAVREILEKYRDRGIRGTLLEHLKVKSGYEHAIELCLGHAGETILLDNGDLLDSILAEVQKSAVFATPSVLNAAETGQSSHNEAAIHFVETQEQLRGWLANLLANYYIVEDAEAARRLREELPFAHIVSRAGEIWHALGWQLRGKAQEAHQSILARSNELNDLNRELELLQSRVNDARSAWEQSRQAFESAENQLEESNQTRQKAAADLATTQFDFDTHQRHWASHESALQSMQNEKRILTEQHHAALQEQQRLAQEIEQLVGAHQELSSQTESMHGRIAELNGEAESKGQQVMDLRIRHATAEQHRQGLAKQEEPIRQRTTELEQRLNQLRAEIADYQNKIEQSQNTITQAQQNISSAETEIIQVQSQIEQALNERQALQAELHAFEEELRQQRRQAMELQTRRGKEDVVVAEQKLHLTALIDRVQHSYHIEIAQIADGMSQEEVKEAVDQSAEAQQKPQPNWTEIGAEVTALREKMENMGPVNLEAITEFEELEQRQTFLQNQERDLTEAKKKLLETIKTINETTQTMFAETFEKIQVNFSQIFMELFGGGRASLTLLDEADPLESGIDIMAKPPGKQLQTISLLSGGERTMTAVALLFSIYMVKPSPFCVLDEMDAPLDESNISRFIHMLQRFVQQSQFVVITHNKRTIAAADILYGVTMQEQGVSKIISVKLARKEEDPLFDQNEKAEETTPVEALSA